MVDHARARRLGERIKVLAAEALDRAVKDPDIGFVTFTDVKVSPDLTHARIYFTVLGSEEDQKLSIKILDRSKGRLRGEIGRHLGIRITPTIELILDEVPATAGAMAELLAEAKRRDEEVERLAKQAEPAGEADPYIKPRVQED
jgi:ribosome-binding factor A